jgi:DNA replication and repair protein RecF
MLRRVNPRLFFTLKKLIIRSMSYLNEIYFEGVRNLKSQRLDGLGQLNVISGINGSGKTSFLEAVHILALAKSFRTRDIRQVIDFKSDSLAVSAKGFTDNSPLPFSLGVQRLKSKQATKAKLNGDALKNVEQLGECLAVSLLDASSFNLVESGPNYRREFIDWLVFHVKQQQFISPWKRYKKALQQRNALLKAGKVDEAALKPWNIELAEQGTVINRLRTETLKAYIPYFESLAKSVVSANLPFGEEDLSKLQFKYKQGWDETCSLEDALQQSQLKDYRYRTTTIGPHRAEIEFNFGEDFKPVAESFSRGQIKVLVCLLKLAQSNYLTSKTARKSIFLLDDLPSELDDNAIEIVLDSLADSGNQVFISSIREELVGDRPLFTDQQVFHVKHGVITRA